MATPTSRTSNALHRLALALTPGLGPTRGRKPTEQSDSGEDIVRSSLSEAESLELQAQSAQHFALKSLDPAHEEFARAAASGMEIISPDDRGWPVRLSQIHDPPLVLYVRGNRRDVWEELPADTKQRLESEWGPEASDQRPKPSSLFNNDEQLTPAGEKILAALKKGELRHIDTKI